MDIEDKTLWLVNPEILDIRTAGGLVLIDIERDMYCELQILSASVWLLIKWTPAGITVMDTVRLLETVVPIPRHILNSETSKAVVNMAHGGWVRRKSQISDRSQAGLDVSKDQIECKVTPVRMTQRLVSFSGKSRETEYEAILLNIRDGRCYSLNDLAVRLWQTIERTPGGISFEEIVETLESHFNAAPEELRRGASGCLQELHRESLVAKRVDADQPSFTASVCSPNDVRLLEFGRLSGRTSIGSHPLVRRLETLQSFIDRLFPQGAQNSLDWRANKLKGAIDNAPGKATESLGSLCSQLQLSLSDRQARRLFKEASGISMKDYARKSRLALAAIELHDTDQAVKVIASNAGYRSYDGFWKAFYDMFLLTPVEFRAFWQRCETAS